MTTKQPPAQKHLEEKDRAAFEEWFLKHFANGKGTFFYSMRESFQFALEYARQEISPDINELVISNDISTQPKASSFEELKWKLQREGNCSFPPEWLGIFKMFYDAGKASALAARIEFPSAAEQAATKFRKWNMSNEQRAFDDGADWMRSQLKLTHESAPNVHHSVQNAEKCTSECTCFERGKSEGMASRIVGPSDDEIENYSKTGNIPKKITKENLCWSARNAARWYRDNLKTEPAVLVLPKEKEEPLEQTAENVDTFRYVRTWNRCISEVRRLNPSLKVSVGE